MVLCSVGNTRLQQDHCSLLCEQLRPCAPKWKEIAQSLQFTLREIESIASIDNVIERWLLWFPGDVRGSKDYATLEQLQQAVDMAGYSALALELTLSDPGTCLYIILGSMKFNYLRVLSYSLVSVNMLWQLEAQSRI